MHTNASTWIPVDAHCTRTHAEIHARTCTNTRKIRLPTTNLLSSPVTGMPRFRLWPSHAVQTCSQLSFGIITVASYTTSLSTPQIQQFSKGNVYEHAYTNTTHPHADTPIHYISEIVLCRVPCRIDYHFPHPKQHILASMLTCTSLPPACSEGEFSCLNGQCVAENLRCDGEHDCDDQSDEVNCSGWFPLLSVEGVKQKGRGRETRNHI